MAQAMRTSRSQLDRILDPDNDHIRLDTLAAAARQGQGRGGHRDGERIGWMLRGRGQGRGVAAGAGFCRAEEVPARGGDAVSAGGVVGVSTTGPYPAGDTSTVYTFCSALL